MENKLKIFVSAYACEPGLGSEIGVGWHWVLEMSKYFELWVLTRQSNQRTIEPWIAEHPEYNHIHFLYYDWPKWARFWKKGMRGVRTYYNIWQYCTNDIVKRTMQENGIKIFHHLTYGNVLWKVSSYGQQQFFIWGPVGGLETIPKEFSWRYDKKWKIIEMIRRMAVRMLPLNGSFKKRCKNADLILCKTNITRSLIPHQYRAKAVLQTDVAVERIERKESVSFDNSDTLQLITVGRLDAWRGFDLCIESVARARQAHPNIYLTIVGCGSDEVRLRQIVKEQGVENNVIFTGKVTADEYRRLLGEADAVMNASLKEGAVTVSFDSMALGKPLICIDTTGYTRYFSNDYAVIVPIETRKKVIEGLKVGILKLCNTSLRNNMGQQAQATGNRFTWKTRGEEIHRLFSEKTKGL